MKKIISIFIFALISVFNISFSSIHNSYAFTLGVSKSYARAVVVAGRRPVAGAAVITGGIRVLPRGCVFGGGIYVCGAVRYRPVIQNGVTVYVVI